MVLRNAEHETEKFEIDDIVTLKIPSLTRETGDHRRIECRVVRFVHQNRYQLQCQHGILSSHYPAAEINRVDKIIGEAMSVRLGNNTKKITLRSVLTLLHGGVKDNLLATAVVYASYRVVALRSRRHAPRPVILTRITILPLEPAIKCKRATTVSNPAPPARRLRAGTRAVEELAEAETNEEEEEEAEEESETSRMRKTGRMVWRRQLC